MIKKTIKYTDYFGTERTEDFYFHLNEQELMEMDYGTTGGIQRVLEKITMEQDMPKLVAYFKEIILGSYGEKSMDGRSFIKIDDDGHRLANRFSQTAAFPVLYMELATDSDAAANFINGIMPQTLQENETVKAELEKLKKANVN